MLHCKIKHVIAIFAHKLFIKMSHRLGILVAIPLNRRNKMDDYIEELLRQREAEQDWLEWPDDAEEV